ncbi:hypothetical protein ACIG53_03550 [Streptomyces bauhiniae]|uniref:hypothetical protein n=1 Tax=Streptomyces bauhiniae TaxID=2340725 RepID=UPI0037D73230
MNIFLKVNAAAVNDVTGEAFRSASGRLVDRRTWTGLVPPAGQDQALLEALILGGLASHRSSKNPLGIVEAFRAEADLLHLRLDSASAVEALLDLLPYREKRGTRRGVPGLQARAIGKQLELRLVRTRDPGTLHPALGARRGSRAAAASPDDEGGVSSSPGERCAAGGSRRDFENAVVRGVRDERVSPSART